MDSYVVGSAIWDGDKVVWKRGGTDIAVYLPIILAHVAQIQEAGGFISVWDLESYLAKLYEPISSNMILAGERASKRRWQLENTSKYFERTQIPPCSSLRLTHKGQEIVSAMRRSPQMCDQYPMLFEDSLVRVYQNPNGEIWLERKEDLRLRMKVSIGPNTVTICFENSNLFSESIQTALAAKNALASLQQQFR